MEKIFQKCRLCLKLGDFCSIFEQDDSIKLSDMVMSFANVQIHEGDGLSDRVCTSCIEHLSSAYLFKLQCERIHMLLLKCPDIQQDSTPTEYNDFLNKEFYMHINDSGGNNTKYESCIEDDSNVTDTSYRDAYEETDSEVESIKCVHCSQVYNHLGSHKCHVTCTIEHNKLQHASSNETLVAVDNAANADQLRTLSNRNETVDVSVSCVLCDEKFNKYDTYVIHLNKCTLNIKLHHYVCPVCHDIYTEKTKYLEHLKVIHFKECSLPKFDTGVDCVDNYQQKIIKTSRPKTVRRQIGWSIEDIYQEIDCVKIDDSKQQSPASSPLKTFFSKLGNESLSKQSTPKKVSFRNFIENGKNKTSQYLPFRKYIENYKLKKRLDGYSPIKDKLQVSSKIKAIFPKEVSDSDYNSPSGTSEESWRLKQNLICACDRKVFMLSEYIHDRDRIASMINELGGVVAENTKMEMLATHFISVLPNDTFTGMMVCSLATGKWLLHVNYVYDSYRSKQFLNETLYEWLKHPKLLEMENTGVEVAKAAVYWHSELRVRNAKFPFEGKQVVLVMKKKYRQYYQMIFKTLKSKPVTYDPRTPGSCCSADYCFVDMKVIERVKLKFFKAHNVPVFPYQYILVYLLNRGHVEDEHKYLLQDSKLIQSQDTVDFLLNNTY